MARAYPLGSNKISFTCPGCGCDHFIDTRGWTFNKDFDAPTFTPSVLVGAQVAEVPRCHSFVTDGRIKFLNDCDHELAGQEVELPCVA